MMKRIIILSLICTVLVLAIDARVIRPIRPRPGQDQPGKPPKLHSDNTLIILYDGKSGKKSLYEYKTFDSIAIRLPEGKNVDEAKEYFEKVKGVIQVNYDRIMHLM